MKRQKTKGGYLLVTPAYSEHLRQWTVRLTVTLDGDDEAIDNHLPVEDARSLSDGLLWAAGEVERITRNGGGSEEEVPNE